jgi:hypothetical protein
MKKQSQKHTIAACLVAAAVCAHASANTTFSDNFNDGNDNGWQRVDTTSGQSWGAGTFDASSGSYQLRGGGPVPTGQQGILLSLYSGSTNPAFRDGYLRATLRSENDTLLYLVMRADIATFTGYIFGASANTGRFFWNKVVNNTVVEEATTIQPSPQFAVGQDWVVEAGAVGSQLSMKAWRLGDPEPPLPQWTHVDFAISTGQFGVGANHWAVLPPATVNATFDDIVFRVPEPSPCLLLITASTYFLMPTCGRANTRRQSRNQVARTLVRPPTD